MEEKGGVRQEVIKGMKTGGVSGLRDQEKVEEKVEQEVDEEVTDGGWIRSSS